MAKINGLDDMTGEELAEDLARGGRFVHFEYCVSIVILTFTRSSDVFYVPAGEGTMGKSLPYTLLSLLLGWWGFPFGPIFTLVAVVTNLSGGKDVTNEVVGALRRSMR